MNALLNALRTLFLCLLSIFIYHTSAEAQASALLDHFTTCTSAITAPWFTYSVSGSQNWDCNSLGFQDNCAYMNGYANSTNNLNEDWLMSPKLDLHSYFNPELVLHARTKYSGNALQVVYSTNYSGSGNPNTATWNSIPITLPTTNSDYWMSCRYNLNTLKNTPFYLAFKYTSTTSAAASWKLDNIQIRDSIDTHYINTGDVAVGNTGPGKAFRFIKSIINTNLTLSVAAPFELSKDNLTFSNTLTYASSDANMLQTAYVRLHPTQAGKEYKSKINFQYENQTQGTEVYLFGSSVDPAKSIKSASWNMRWFGYPSFCSCDTALAKKNALAVMRNLGADLYFLQEVVSTSQVRSICDSLGPNYKCLISNFATSANDSNDSQYGTAQKLAYIYNTQKIQALYSFGLLKSTYPANNNPYYCFSSGRFPFVLKAKINLGQIQDTAIFVNIHAKADNTNSDYQRRECGSLGMKDSLNALFPNNKVIIMGDYNDYLEGSTVSGQTLTPYHDLLSNGFQGLSLPSLYPGWSSFSGTSNHLIDNVVCSSEAVANYVDSSYNILHEMEEIIPDYAQTTSDHYPVLAYWQFTGPNAQDHVIAENPAYQIVSPSGNELTIFSLETQPEQIQITVRSFAGSIVHQEMVQNKRMLRLLCNEIQQGLYVVEIKKNNQPFFYKWLVIR